MSSPPLASTATLLRRVQEGDEHARAMLIERCLPPLRRWARGRLRGPARGVADTDDLVQTTVVKTLDRMDQITILGTGSFLGYMRQVLLNSVRDEVRRFGRRPLHKALGEGTGEIAELPGPATDPTLLASYDEALDLLTPEQRDAVVLRFEFGMTFPEIAAELGLESADAARMRVSRSLVALAEALS